MVHIGNRVIGGGNPILIQSMTNTKTYDVAATVAQIQRLTEAGCDIVRCTVPDMEAAKAIALIKKEITIPLVADIHFDAFTHIITSDDLILITRLSYPKSSIICTLSNALSTIPSAVTPLYFSISSFSNEPLFTPTRIGNCSADSAPY